MSAAVPESFAEQAIAKFELLNAQDHRDLRVGFRRDSRQHFVRIVVDEFMAAAVCCPIMLTKDASSGDFYATALLGFKPGECVLRNAAERGGFEPLNFQREGFFTCGEAIAIDRANARFGQQGDLLFDDAQQPSARLRQIQRVLNRLQDGAQKTDRFIRVLLNLKLVEPIDVAMNFDDGERIVLKGLYTVSMDSLQALSSADILLLFRSGDLQRIYAMHASLGRIAVLAEQRNRLLCSPPST